MSSVIRILIAEDDSELFEVCRKRFSSASDCEVVGHVHNGREVIAAVERLRPDILTIDRESPGIGGLEILPVIRWCSPNTKVIVLSGCDDEATVLEALDLGARGYIVKDDGIDMIKVVRAVQRGEVWARRRVVARLLDRLVCLASLAFQEEGEFAPAPCFVKPIQ
ncbi:LuxR family two component transcriptional regulator [Candidatus Methylomirabilis lanthanidiphila]|uniref:LuxR family two component transcriptional regulator n=1 Tax=Candidatus Methylomirabilis lanthanidiphila TaxID=2211376 RepID=A0A564ZH72_9BACT|nr:response regulator transcription factor [Candidatus Methylomirabilis lanthanidiphila]VUZ84503.1 LuxR family two component transcriptional regulator [Candidatus Methylomirabilis lanthanidiphila]